MPSSAIKAVLNHVHGQDNARPARSGAMEPNGETSAETVVGDFDAADELLFAAENGELARFRAGPRAAIGTDRPPG